MTDPNEKEPKDAQEQHSEAKEQENTNQADQHGNWNKNMQIDEEGNEVSADDV